MKLTIELPAKRLLERDVDSVTLPGAAGQFTVLAGHDLLVSTLVPGRLFFRYLDGEGKPQREDYAIGDGIVEVLKDGASVFVRSAEKASASGKLDHDHG